MIKIPWGTTASPAWCGGTVVIGIAWRKPMPHPMKELAEVEPQRPDLSGLSVETTLCTWQKRRAGESVRVLPRPPVGVRYRVTLLRPIVLRAFPAPRKH